MENLVRIILLTVFLHEEEVPGSMSSHSVRKRGFKFRHLRTADVYKESSNWSEFRFSLRQIVKKRLRIELPKKIIRSEQT